MRKSTSEKTIKKYMAMVSKPGRVFTEQEIISLRSFLNSKLSDNLPLKASILGLFRTSAAAVPFQLTREQQLKGFEWLQRTQLNKKGQLRRAQNVFLSAEHVTMLQNFTRFEFIGLRDSSQFGPMMSGYSNYLPIYRLHDADGNYFDYVASIHGTPEIIKTHIAKAPRALALVGG